MFEEDFADATSMRGIPVDPDFQVLEELSLKCQQVFHVTENRLDLRRGEHVRPPPALRNVSFRDIPQDLDEVSFGIEQLPNDARSHLVVRE